MKISFFSVLLFAVVSSAVVTAGCNQEAAGPVIHESQSVPKDAATAMRADIHMNAGTLKLAGGSSGWLDANFDYNIPQWKPTITYNAVGASGDLRVEQPGGNQNRSNTRNEWDLRLNDDIPTDVTTELGAGDANLNLGTVTLRSLSIEIGAGTLNLDLRGHPKRSYEVRIRGGAGDATVRLPADVGLYVEAGGGIGDVSVKGLRHEGDHWLNDAYATAPVQVHANIKGGVGGITVIAE